MYNYIKGSIKKVTPKYIVVENNNIGYEIITPNPYSFSLDKDETIYIYQYVKEDLICLYGFKSEDEKDMFLRLISVSGIGPKSALTILASLTIDEIINAIESGDAPYLKKIPGIGQKASLQIILDLKGKLSYNKTTDSPKLELITDALISLGYNKKDISKVVENLDFSLDEGLLIKQSLKMLQKN